MKKKLIVCFAALAVCFMSAAFAKSNSEPESAPATNFEGAAENTSVLDLSAIKGFDERIRIVSAFDGMDEFLVHICRSKRKGWQYFGTAHTDSSGDKDFVDSNHDAKKCRWVAITPLSGKTYKYILKVADSDLYITVFPKK